MNELIPITNRVIEDENVLTCNARELHSLLEVGRDFPTWIKARIVKYEFTEGVDFIVEYCSPDLGSKRRGGHNLIEYHISTDMAKELSMVENNDIGKQARKYFIEAEKALRAISVAGAIPLTIEEQLAQSVLLANKVIAEKNAQIEYMKPKVELLDMFMGQPDEMKLAVAAKLMYKKTGKGVINLVRDMVARKILYRQGKDLLPDQKLQGKGYFSVHYQDIDNLKHPKPQTLITKAGVKWVLDEMEKKPLDIAV